MRYVINITGEIELAPVLPVQREFKIESLDTTPSFTADFVGVAITAWVEASKRAGQVKPDMQLKLQIHQYSDTDESTPIDSFVTTLQMYHRYNSNLMTFIASLFDTIRQFVE